MEEWKTIATEIQARSKVLAEEGGTPSGWIDLADHPELEPFLENDRALPPPADLPGVEQMAMGGGFGEFYTTYRMITRRAHPNWDAARSRLSWNEQTRRFAPVATPTAVELGDPYVGLCMHVVARLINNYFPHSPDEFCGFDAGATRDLVAKVWAYEGRIESSYASDPMMNSKEKDLVRCAEEAGFPEVHVELLVDVEPGTRVVDWERMVNTSPNPNARAIGEALRGALSDEELARFEKHGRPLVDAGRSTLRSAFAYLRAVKT